MQQARASALTSGSRSSCSSSRPAWSAHLAGRAARRGRRKGPEGRRRVPRRDQGGVRRRDQVEEHRSSRGQEVRRREAAPHHSSPHSPERTDQPPEAPALVRRSPVVGRPRPPRLGTRPARPVAARRLPAAPLAARRARAVPHTPGTRADAQSCWTHTPRTTSPRLRNDRPTHNHRASRGDTLRHAQ